MTLSQPVRAWIVAMTASLFFFFFFMQWTMFNALSPALIEHFSVSARAMSQLCATYFYMNMICLFPAGMILDRYPTRRVMLLMLFIALIGTLGLVWSPSFFLASCCRVLVGIAGSFGLISCVRLASRWFPAKSLALVIGMIVMVAMMGGVVAQTPFTLLTDHYGWRTTIYVDAGLGVLIGVLIALLVRDEPSEPVEGLASHAAKLPFWEAVRSTVLNRKNWFTGLYISLMNLPIMVFAFWGSFYFVQNWHLSRASASWLDTCLLLGAIVGSPVLGWFSDRIGQRRLPMILCAVALFVLSFFLYEAQTLSVIGLAILIAFMGFFTSGQVIGYPFIAESNPMDLTATAEGFASVLIMAGGLSQKWFGDLLNHYGTHVTVHHLAHYSHASYKAALLMFPVAALLAWLLAFFIRERSN